jgi:AraC-like DNA-binding protein
MTSALKESSKGGEATPWSATTQCRPCRNLVNQNPGRSMRSLARELGVSEKTVRNRMQQDIRYKSYAMRRGQFMNQVTKERRLEKAKLLLNKLKNPAANGQLIFFSVGKNFSQDQKINRKNNRWLCSDISKVPIVMSTKFPATVMVPGGGSATRVT